MAKAFALAGLLYLFAVVWCSPASAWRYYRSVPPFGLRGSDYVRLPEAQAEPYRALTHYLESESDAFITLPGLNSLYFWTGERPPTYFNASEVILMNATQQARVVAALDHAKHPLIVLDDRGASFVAPKGPLASLIRERCREVRRIGNFRILIVETALNRP